LDREHRGESLRRAGQQWEVDVGAIAESEFVDLPLSGE
jgi:hypothetical protein